MSKGADLLTNKAIPRQTIKKQTTRQKLCKFNTGRKRDSQEKKRKQICNMTQKSMAKFKLQKTNINKYKRETFFFTFLISSQQ